MATRGESARDAAGRRNAGGLARDLELVEVLASPQAPAGGLGVVRLAELTQRDKAAVSRAAATMADAGLLIRNPDSGAYRLGHRLYALAARTQEASMVEQLRPLLRSVARHCRETTHLSVLRSDQVLTLASELSPNEVRTSSWQGRTAEVLRTPSGRVLLSGWDDAEIVDWWEVRHGADAGLDALLSEIQQIRRRGYATSDGEWEPGVVAASAALRGATGDVIAALNVSAPKGRVGGGLARLGRYVARAAAGVQL